MKGKAPIKYCDIKTRLGIKVDTKADDGLAYFTHYIQNSSNGVSQYYKKHAETFLSEHQSILTVNEIQDIESLLPVSWDGVPFPPPEIPKFTFIDLFAGIGGIRMAFQNLGGKCVFTSEWNPYAKITYEANFGEVPFGDITKIPESSIPEHQILVAGFPCQPFSIAGVSKKNALGREHGFRDLTQGTLFFDIARILDAKKPPAFMLENVKNLVSHDKGKTFEVIKRTLTDLGYSIHYKVLDGKHFVPQHRERILIVGFRNDIFNGQEGFTFPTMSEPTEKLKGILLPEVDDKYTLSNKLWNYLQDYSAKHKLKGNGFGFGLADREGISRTLSARYYKDGAEILIPEPGKNPRRLTPRECARLQGFPDNFIFQVSENQLYRQFGNSVVMPLIQAVGSKIVQVLITNNGKLSSQSCSVSTTG